MEPRKRKRLWLIVALGAVILLALLFLIAPGEKEPTYNGRSLSQWLELNGNPFFAAIDDPARFEAPKALRAIGTNALPQLVRWIAYEPPSWRLKLVNLAQTHPMSIGAHPRLNKLVFGPLTRSHNAAEAFTALGPTAAPAIPDLERLLHTTAAPGTKSRALLALASIGPDAVPAVLGVVSNLNHPADTWMLSPLARLGSTPELVFPVLMSRVQCTNLFVGVSIIQFLPVLQVEPALVLQALTNCLKDPRPEIRATTVYALAQMGRNAWPALPALSDVLNDPDPAIRASARKAINDITGFTAQ